VKLALTATPGASESGPILLRGSLEKSFETGRRMGCQGVELHLRRPEDVAAEDILRLSREYGLSVPTLGTGMAAVQDGLTFSDPDPSVRAEAVDIIHRHIDLASHIRSAVTIGLIVGKAGQAASERPERLARAVSCLEACARHAARQGVILFLEPLNRYESDSLNTLSQAVAVIDQIGAGNVRLLADTFHMNIEEVDLAATLAESGSLLGHVHLADSNREAPGHGHTDLASVVAALRTAGFAGYLSFEILPKPNELQALEDAVGYVRRLLG
jgi:sugar phosphate isomerase/epimerase